MKIIGINNEMYISSACLISDGKVVAAAAEERFTREKITRKFPDKAVKYCLREAGIAMRDVDYIATAWNPGVYFTKFNPVLSGRRRHLVEQLFSVPDHLMNFHDRAMVDHMYQELHGEFGKTAIYYITHHRAHAANGFLISPFESAAILTADAQGEFESATFCQGKGNKIEFIKGMNYPTSLGAFYSTFTEFLGFKPNSDEWKVMAMASYTSAKNRYYDLMKSDVVRLLDDGEFELNLNYFKGFIHDQPNLYTKKLVERFGPAREPDGTIDGHHYEIAAALQKMSEDISAHMLRWLHKKTGERNVVLSGGSFMNSVFNGKVTELTPFEKIFISSCPDDSGNCFGAAYYLYNHILGKPRGEPMIHNYFGPQYSNPEIEKTLTGYGVRHRMEHDIEGYAARLISEGKIIGWFQGRMEFGQRALGNRSILADPRREEMKDKVNRAVKFREAFRPFAPAVLKERQEEYFDTNGGGDVPFMEKVYHVKAEMRSRIPAVTHVDGSGRIQTVTRDSNPRFYGLIREFEKLSGIPVVLNTSFNLNGEPVVCTPTDAIRTFFSCGLDALVIGNYVITKE